ncbi:unnamed protein product [Blepharisma stoltei]|uniref:Rab-GAP TBC domain-containing protein n=1 Tax=Blepharisma stoltei TaxID=1481888 RepID=A0AAU9II45_9CILI|nr:unnamed protein product [Blepharisma stoltei]
MLARSEILQFLNTCEIASLYVLNKSHNKSLKADRAIKSSIWRGDLPDEVRAKYWIYQCPLYTVQEDSRKLLRISDPTANTYELIQLRIELGEGLEEIGLNIDTVKNDIAKDIPRTLLVANSKREQEKLFRILLALAYVKPSIGYCQGINFLASVILKVVRNEEVAFWLLLGVIKKWDMENMFVPGVPDLSLREHQMNHYFMILLPDLYSHFRRAGITSSFFITRWFMTLFSTYLPFSTLVKVWDCFFLEGWKVIIKVSIAILKELKPMFLQMDVEEISFVLRDTQKELHLDYKSLLEKGFGIVVSSKELKNIEENFYKDQANLKMQAAEHTHTLTDQEMIMLRWAKSQLSSIDPPTRKDIKEFQKKLEKLDIDLETLHKHHLSVSMELLHVQKEIESLAEKKRNYFRILKDMETKFKQSKSFFKKLVPGKMKKILSSKTGNKLNITEIKQEDIADCQQKLNYIEQELKELYMQQKEKYSIYRDAQTRVEELKEKKQSYSEQLCEFISLQMVKNDSSPRIRHTPHPVSF